MHLLVATLTDTALADRRHAVLMTGLGAEVAQRGGLGPELIARTAATVGEMVELARQDGARAVGLVATEFARGAADAEQFARAVQERTGETLRVLTGEQEARFSYLGATAFRVRPGLPAVVADIGGGSTEVILGTGTRPRQGTSLKLGSDQLLRLVNADDPPSERQAAHAEARASMIMEAAPAGEGSLIATGGSAANLPVLLGLARPVPEATQPGLIEERGVAWTEVDRLQVDSARQLVLSIPSSDLASRTGLGLRRARLMAGGVLILVALLDHYGADRLSVTERGLRDGVILAMAANRRKGESDG